MRIIRRYGNRKLYDVQGSSYVTLQELGGIMRRGDEIRVVDYRTEKDLTTATMAQILFEEEKRGPRLGAKNLAQIIRRGLPA